MDGPCTSNNNNVPSVEVASPLTPLVVFDVTSVTVEVFIVVEVAETADSLICWLTVWSLTESRVMSALISEVVVSL